MHKVGNLKQVCTKSSLQNEINKLKYRRSYLTTCAPFWTGNSVNSSQHFVTVTMKVFHFLLLRSKFCVFFLQNLHNNSLLRASQTCADTYTFLLSYNFGLNVDLRRTPTPTSFSMSLVSIAEFPFNLCFSSKITRNFLPAFQLSRYIIMTLNKLET